MYKAPVLLITPASILSVDPVLTALRDRKVRLRTQARGLSRTHTRAQGVSAVVDTRAHYHVLSAIDDVVYRRFSSIYQLAPRLFPFAVYPYKLRQMWLENAHNSIKLSPGCYEAMMRELTKLQDIANSPTVESMPVRESLSQAWALVCDSSAPPALMQRAIGLSQDKNYNVAWECPALESCGASFGSGQEVAIARMYRFLREDVQNRVVLSVVGSQWCVALREALQGIGAGACMQPTPNHKKLIAMLSDDVKPMARYALYGEPSHDYLGFLEGEASPYNRNAKLQIVLEAP